jgi:hypothetical protein
MGDSQIFDYMNRILHTPLGDGAYGRHGLQRRVAAARNVCIGGGQGIAAIFERLWREWAGSLALIHALPVTGRPCLWGS